MYCGGRVVSRSGSERSRQGEQREQRSGGGAPDVVAAFFLGGSGHSEREDQRDEEVCNPVAGGGETRCPAARPQRENLREKTHASSSSSVLDR